MAKNNKRPNPDSLLTVGLDVGYGAVKAVTSDTALVFPSVCGHARQIKFQQDEIAARHPGDQIQDDEGRWFVGDLALIPDDLKHEVVREVTERTIETWHSERGLAVPEYSFCLHDRDTSDYGLSQVHAHIFIAGTIENSLGERESHRVGKAQVVATPYALEREDNLHRIAREQMEQVLDRTIGLEWRDLRPSDLEPTSPEHQTIWDDLMADVTVDPPQTEKPQPPSIQEPSPGFDLEL